MEVPFAGHPTIGAAVAIAISTGARHPVLVEKIGDVAVEAALVAPGIGSASFEVPRVAEPGPSFDISPARVMDAIGLDERDLDQDRRITYYDGGIRFVLIPLRNEEAVSRARLDLGAWRESFEHAWTSQLYLVARRQEPDEFRVRLFAPGMGVSEDPATGSAAAVLGRYVADQRGAGRHELVIRQGDEIGRASRIGVIADKDHHGALRVFVSGFATLTMKGKLIRSGSGTGALGENRS